MPSPLYYVSDKTIQQLQNSVVANLDRYKGSGFTDLAGQPGWDIPLGVDYDADLLQTLDTSKPMQVAQIDLKNSIIVGRALASLDPSTANEERIWIRLSHVEAFEYARLRWLAGKNDDQIPGEVRRHFFAANQTGIRDDNALSRLWWNYQIAQTCMPEDVKGALSLIMKTADIRSNFVERIWMTSRRQISGAVLRAMSSEDWITDNEAQFRAFMKSVNRLGGGIVFEALSGADTDAFVQECITYAKAEEAA